MSVTKEQFTKMGVVRRAAFVEKTDPVAYRSLYALHGHMPTEFASKLYALGLSLIKNQQDEQGIGIVPTGKDVPCGVCTECRLGFPKRCLKFGLMQAGSKKHEKQKKKFASVLASDAWKGHGTGHSGGGSATYARCAHKHPPLLLKPGITIQGGSASDPIKGHYDIYISLDRGTDTDARAYPWNEGQFIFFPITDMAVPTNTAEFKKMIKWTAEQLEEGKKVHVGCIGGHGRTGLFLAALYAHMSGDMDAITYVRKNYCNKAVETSGQIDFLHGHFGIKKVKGSKTWGSSSTFDWANSSQGWKKFPTHTVGVDRTKASRNEGARYNERFEPSGDDISAAVEYIPGSVGNVWGVV